MKSLIRDIRRQPQHVRELMAGLCTVVVVSMVIAAWFHSFQNNIYAMLNEPAESGTERALAVSNQSLFGSIGSSFKDFGLVMAQMFGTFTGPGENTIKVENSNSVEVHLLPVWGNK